jgi:hypothetical protein
MRMNLKDSIQVKTLANGQFEVRTTSGDRRSGTAATMPSLSQMTRPANMDQPHAKVLDFRRLSK